MKRFLFALALLSACDDRPEAPSAAQNAQLDEAEAMLEEETRQEKGPAAEATDP